MMMMFIIMEYLLNVSSLLYVYYLHKEVLTKVNSRFMKVCKYKQRQKNVFADQLNKYDVVKVNLKII